MILIAGFSLLFFYKGMLCSLVTQISTEQTVASGSELMLLCTYDTSLSNPDLYWYRKRLDESFQFILYKDNTRSHYADFAQGRFSVQHGQTQKTFHLVISQVRMEDSATYYCAVGSHGDAGAQEVCTQTSGEQLSRATPQGGPQP
uniref:T cell receptor delta variable 3 n=1 Tax=Sciurus vulgaris TaxID=55149 RepID=A0A8D2ATQ1_SCIVU